MKLLIDICTVLCRVLKNAHLAELNIGHCVGLTNTSFFWGGGGLTKP